MPYLGNLLESKIAKFKEEIFNFNEKSQNWLFNLSVATTYQ